MLAPVGLSATRSVLVCTGTPPPYVRHGNPQFGAATREVPVIVHEPRVVTSEEYVQSHLAHSAGGYAYVPTGRFRAHVGSYQEFAPRAVPRFTNASRLYHVRSGLPPSFSQRHDEIHYAAGGLAQEQATADSEFGAIAYRERLRATGDSWQDHLHHGHATRHTPPHHAGPPRPRSAGCAARSGSQQSQQRAVQQRSRLHSQSGLAQHSAQHNTGDWASTHHREHKGTKAWEGGASEGCGDGLRWEGPLGGPFHQEGTAERLRPGPIDYSDKGNAADEQLNSHGAGLRWEGSFGGPFRRA